MIRIIKGIELRQKNPKTNICKTKRLIKIYFDAK